MPTPSVTAGSVCGPGAQVPGLFFFESLVWYNKGMKNILLLFLLLFVGIFAVSLPVLAVLPSLDVMISSVNVKQGDTIVFVVKNEPQDVVGKVGAVKIRFFRSENQLDWVGIIGMPVSKRPGKYAVLISTPGKASFRTTVTVSKTKWPVTNLEVTPDLAQKGYTAKSIVNTVQNDENKQLEGVLSVIDSPNYVSKPFIYPLQSISIVGPFGDIRKSGKYEIQHMGADLKAANGTSVQAVNDGKVVFEKEGMVDYGNIMIIDHGLGVYSLYLHLSQFNAKVGDFVKQGDVIALSGATGYVTGPHLHFGIKVRGSGVDPLKFIAATQNTW
jgi:murein DD-endopeptidase MepM/ murein hydrolase activator NlpD